MVVLCSSGFSNPRVLDRVLTRTSNPIRSAGIVVTAAVPDKSANRWVGATRDAMEEAGISKVAYHDFELDPSAKLEDYDLIFICGGNPYYLFLHSQLASAGPVLERCHNQGKILVGTSAGAMLLASGIFYVDQFNKIMNFGPERGNTVGLEDPSGLCLAPQILFPHYDMFLSRMPELESQLRKIENRDGVTITRLNEGEAIIRVGEEEELVRRL